MFKCKATVDADVRGGERRQRYCTTGQGASGPEGGRRGGGGEENLSFSDRSLVSSQPCQQEPVNTFTVLRKKHRENDRKGAERRNQGNSICPKGQSKVEVSKCAVLHCVHVCVCVEVTYHRTRLVQAWRTLFSLLAL